MALNGNEIITLQFGHYSNFVGTHWWNCQDAGFEYTLDTPSEIDHDVLFREGLTSRGEVTFTPRLLLVDLKGTLGALPEAGRLYDAPPIPTPALPHWPPDKVSIQTQEGRPKNEFLQDLEQGETSAANLPTGLKEGGRAVPKLYHLDDSVMSWSDFLRPHLHPRSINLVQEYQHGDSSLPFDTFPLGQAQWLRPSFQEELTDRLRLYMEESHNLQGFQVLLDSVDGFSGLGCAGVQHLRDEYPSKAVWCVACQPPVPSSSHKRGDCVRVLNQALALSSLAEHASLFSPVSGATEAWRSLGRPLHLPHLSYRADLPYHTSAIVAAALDTVSLLYRLRSKTGLLSDLTSRFSLCGRVAAGLSVALPVPMRREATLLDTLEAWTGPLTTPLIPAVGPPTQEALVLRGLSELRLMRPDQRDPSSMNPAYSCRSLSQLIGTYRQFVEQTRAATRVCTADSPLRTSAPFPHLFHSSVATDGSLDSQPRSQHLGVGEVPVMAGLHSHSGLGPLLETLHTEAKAVNIRSLHQFADSGLESTELSESLEQLLCLSENYSDNHLDM